jgi:hypothetical protein
LGGRFAQPKPNQLWQLSPTAWPKPCWTKRASKGAAYDPPRKSRISRRRALAIARLLERGKEERVYAMPRTRHAIREFRTGRLPAEGV